MIRGLRSVALAGLLLALAGAQADAFEQRRCRCAAGLANLQKHFLTLGAKVRRGEPVTIVAIGSSSTEGTPSLRKSAVYPAVLERLLAARWGAGVKVLNRGRGGETIPQTIARFETDVFRNRPDLVIWQLGVNDVLTENGIASRVADIEQMLDRLAATSVPTILVDLQYAPRVAQDPDTPAMQAAIRAAAAKRRNTVVFARYDIMKTIVEAGEATLPEMVERDGLHMSELGHGCVGALLAEGIARAIGDGKLLASAH